MVCLDNNMIFVYFKILFNLFSFLNVYLYLSRLLIKYLFKYVYIVGIVNF